MINRQTIDRALFAVLALPLGTGLSLIQTEYETAVLLKVLASTHAHRVTTDLRGIELKILARFDLVFVGDSIDGHQ